MMHIEFWLNIVTIILLVPAIFYMARFCRGLEKMRQNRETLLELAQTLRQMAQKYENKTSPKTAAQIVETEGGAPTEEPLRRQPQNEISSLREPHFETRGATDKTEENQYSSEAEKELLQALRSIK